MFTTMYYLLLVLYNWIMEGFYISSFSEIRKVRLLSSARAKDLDSANRSLKLALQYVSGSLTKFENLAKSSGEHKLVQIGLKSDSMQIIQRSVHHIVSIALFHRYIDTLVFIINIYLN